MTSFLVKGTFDVIDTSCQISPRRTRASYVQAAFATSGNVKIKAAIKYFIYIFPLSCEIIIQYICT